MLLILTNTQFLSKISEFFYYYFTISYNTTTTETRFNFKLRLVFLDIPGCKQALKKSYKEILFRFWILFLSSWLLRKLHSETFPQLYHARFLWRVSLSHEKQNKWNGISFGVERQGHGVDRGAYVICI